MKSEISYNCDLKSALPLAIDKQHFQLQLQYKLNYIQLVGELIYTMVTCHPDIDFTVTKLSQYSSNPATEHYTVIKEILYYLQYTKNDGIHWWCSHMNESLPPSITSHKTKKSDSKSKIQDSSSTLKVAVDANWGDTTHRRYVSGFVLKLVGVAVYYKIRY